MPLSRPRHPRRGRCRSQRACERTGAPVLSSAITGPGSDRLAEGCRYRRDLVPVLDPDTVSGLRVAVVSLEPDLSISEVAAATGLSVRVLRHWEILGLVRAQRHASGHRRYGRPELVRLTRAVAPRRAGLGLHDIAAVPGDQPAAVPTA